MDELDLQLDEVVMFELPTLACNAAFSLRLRSRWPGWSAHDDAGWLFAAELLEDGEGMAVLLREAQDLLEELGLPSIRFCLDGGVYTLEAQRTEAGAALAGSL
ncbi:MAG TPA: hypothetical protein VHZ77_00920 [Gaiellaceae bacterium]|jgi:hypothetical protein|nr:hypothetical protein [Gaiellaceae bacterium]